jgi:single-strand DNA-binding protein
MAGDTTITIIGNAVTEPELKFLPSGKAVANFTVASTPRFFDKKANEWRDGEGLFLRCAIWGQAAENMVESVVKGTRLVVVGRLKQRSYETSAGEKRTVVELEADEVAVSLAFAVAKVNRVAKGSTSGGISAADDPWAAAPAGGF